MRQRIAGRVALVSGGARGMGASHARVLASEGASVLVGDLLDVEGEALAGALREEGLDVRYSHLDVTSEESWRVAVQGCMGAWGRLDIVINNAGVLGGHGGPEEEDLASWNRTLAVNQTGTYLGIRTAVPAIRAGGNGGSIVNVSSISGFVGDGDYFAYCATKGAIRMMSRAAALKYAADRIRVNSVCPGIVKTPMNDEEEDPGSYIDQTPLGRMADPVEISNAVLFLASDEASYLTGSDLVVDGGFLAH